MTVVINNPKGEVALPPPPTKADGTPYLFEMIFEAGKSRAYSDSYSGLCEALIPGYREEADNPDETALVYLRLKFAVNVQVQLQAELLSEADSETLARCSQEQLALLQAPRDVPPQPPEGKWDCPVPLVLVESYYQPQGDLPRPHGQFPAEGAEGEAEAGEDNNNDSVIWLDPSGEKELLYSLHHAAFIWLAQRKTAPAPVPTSAPVQAQAQPSLKETQTPAAPALNRPTGSQPG